MASTIEDQVKAALIALEFTPDEIHLETTTSGSIGGHIVSGSFAGHSQMERQEQLWNGLRERLQAPELTKIVALLTVTPEEIADE